MNDFDQRLARLEARAEIETLMQAYALAADDKYHAAKAKKPQAVIDQAAARQAACFTPDAIWHGQKFGGDLQGRAAIEGFFRKSPWHFTAHHYGSPHIRIDGHQAFAQWRLLELGIREADGVLVLMSGDISQELARLPDEGWRIASMVFDRLHAVELSADPESLKLLIP